MFRYFVELSYRGSNYHGWQYQPNAITVQEIISKNFSKVFRRPTEIIGAGRTDTGVHARFFVAHFDTETALENPDCYVVKFNKMLPPDIAIDRIYRVNTMAHSRFSAISRAYEYLLVKKKSPFLLNQAWYYPHKLDVAAMNEAAALLPKYEDFTSFSKLHTDVKTNNCDVRLAFWRSDNGMLIFRIEADRFLRNMVRAIVGTLLDVGRRKIAIGDFEEIILSKNRGKAGLSVPAHGLYLCDIKYPKSVVEGI